MPDYDKKKVLIADDDAIMRYLLKIILLAAGHTVVGEARNGEQAIAMVEKTSPDRHPHAKNGWHAMPGIAPGLDA